MRIRGDAGCGTRDWCVSPFICGVSAASACAMAAARQPQEWFEKVVAHHGLVVPPLELNACVAVAQLPPIHNDPSDRFVIAAAKLHDLTVVTGDQRFLKHSVSVLS